MERDILSTRSASWEANAMCWKLMLMGRIVETGLGNFIHWVPPNQKELNILLSNVLMIYCISFSIQRSLLSI